MMTLALPPSPPPQRLSTAIVPQTAIVPHERTPLTADDALEVIITRDQIYECVRRALSPRTQPKDYDVIVHGFGFKAWYDANPKPARADDHAPTHRRSR